MEAIRNNITAVAVATASALLVAVLVAGRELLRVRSIALAYGHSYRDEMVVFALVVVSAVALGAVVVIAVALAEGAGRKIIVLIGSVPLAVFASWPVYWYTYRGQPRGIHISIAGEYRLAQPAGLIAALLVYVVSSAVISAIRRRRMLG